jgi:hypothetical protein
MSIEGQGYGRNPEWENHKGQNILLAKKIDGLLLEAPGQSPLITILEKAGFEEGNAFDVFLTFLKGLDRSDQDLQKVEGMDDLALSLEEKKITIGHSSCLEHVSNSWRRLYLEVGYSEDFKDSPLGSDIESLPKDFYFPVYIIQAGTSILYDDEDRKASSCYGNFANDAIGRDGSYYRFTNVYCFNYSGQGVKIENVTKMGELEDWFDIDDVVAARKGFARLNFTPSEENSRVVPLTEEDYEKVNSMFADIDSGQYKFAAL